MLMVHGKGMALTSDPSLRIGKKLLWEERKLVEHRVGIFKLEEVAYISEDNILWYHYTSKLIL